MEAKIIAKEDMAGLLDRIIRTHRVHAPVGRKDALYFEALKSGDEACLDFANTKMSPKGILFPQSEDLFGYRSGTGDVEIRPFSFEKSEQVLFGVRPCDAKGIQFLDRFFSDGPGDPYYEKRRNGTVVVALGCTEPHEGCFCHSLGGGPCGEEGSDLLLIDIGEAYLIRIVTGRGAALLSDEGLQDASPDHLAAAAEVVRQAEEAMGPRLELEGAEKILAERFHDPVWDGLSEKCIGCGICTYLCPTCHCFDLCEETRNSEGRRIRIWDSCQYALFTREASGHNPRDTQGKRIRQRVMHKFSYLPEELGLPGCTGCGRCVTECPVNLDIRQVLTSLLRAEEAS
ncbi:MAG: 4Fe-4S dicluster domain-containing protein [Deltaproteobacteria bacterium]|nr:4Fe-4S dicluster domain-containing protein [Deltaproteobacteria bacterium]